MKNIYQESLLFHKKNKGKLSVVSRVSVSTRHDLSLAYTPGVAEVSREIGRDARKAYDYTLKSRTIAVVSDGSAILGLGNLGATSALPVMEGKSILFKEFGGIDAFPLCLETQDTEEIIETVKRIAPAFGGINLEDISAPRCFEIERRLQRELDIPVMHDDQHGTAVVVLAAFINALKVRKTRVANARVLINGAGAAGIAVLNILLSYGVRDIIVCDSKGAIYRGRKGLEPLKKRVAEKTNKRNMKGSLEDVVEGREIFIGVSRGNVLTEAMVKSMAHRPVIFALANPIPEIMPDAAKRAGAYIIATGRSDFPNQINNLLAFPGIFRGALDNKIRQFKDRMFIQAAKNIASYVKRPTPARIIPDILDKRVVREVARAMK